MVERNLQMVLLHYRQMQAPSSTFSAPGRPAEEERNASMDLEASLNSTN